MLPNGRLFVSCRTSGSLNRPLAALTSGAPNPFLRKPLWPLAALTSGAPIPSLRKPLWALAALTSGAPSPSLRKPLWALAALVSGAPCPLFEKAASAPRRERRMRPGYSVIFTFSPSAVSTSTRTKPGCVLAKAVSSSSTGSTSGGIFSGAQRRRIYETKREESSALGHQI